MQSAEMPIEELLQLLEDAHPELEVLRRAATAPTYVVGGAVRDLLLGRPRTDLDVVVQGDASELAAALGAEAIEHERFSTATVELDGHLVDIASARTESYPHPGTLPVVVRAPDLEADLARRDFTVNALAIPLLGEARLIDPFGGRADLEAGLLRVLHPGSFLDDPTRAIRAARYAARFGFELEEHTAALVRGAELGTISGDRRRAELLRLASEASAPRGFQLLAEWGLVETRPGGIELAGRAIELLAAAPWRDEAPLAETVVAAALGPAGGEVALAQSEPDRPSRAVELAAGHGPLELALARALGAEWLDRYLLEWRSVALEIDGADLLAAGVPEGPALGRGLRAALQRKLDGEASGRAQELTAALQAAQNP